MNNNEMMQTLNDTLKDLSSSVDRFRYVIKHARSHGLKVVQTTSFGIESAMMIHHLAMAGSIADVPVVFIDTGYLPKETYEFAEQMKARYTNLDLRIYQSDISPARMEAIYGKLWEDDSDIAHQRYNTMRKVVPMEKALQDLDATIILTGLRSSQTKHRQNLSFVNADHGSAGDRLRWKVCPLLDWDAEAVANFFVQEQLPYHPLFYQGYRTVGDWHSSQPFDPSVHKSVRDTRFHGRTQECGLHVSISNISVSEEEEEASPPSLMTASDSSASLVSTQDIDGFTIYGRPNCKYCRAAKKLLQSLAQEIEPGVSIYEVHVGQDISNEELLQKLGNHIKTVPQIIYNGSYIGGYDDLCAWGPTQYNETAFLELVKAITIE